MAASVAGGLAKVSDDTAMPANSEIRGGSTLQQLPQEKSTMSLRYAGVPGCGGRMYYGSIFGGPETSKRIMQIKKRSRQYMHKQLLNPKKSK